MSVHREEMRRKLLELARPVVNRIAEHRRGEAFKSAVETVWPWFLAAPLARLALAFMGFEIPGVWAFVALAPAAPAAILLLTVLSREGERAGQREALMMIDDQLGLADRMTTAAEFLAMPQRTPMMDAAIRDADRAIAAAAAGWVAPPHRRLRIPKTAPLLLVVMAILFLVPTFSPEWAAPADGGEVAEVVLPVAADESIERGDQRPVDERGLRPGEEVETRRPRQGRDEGAGDSDAGVEPEDEINKEKRASSTSGRSAKTQTSGGNNSSRGQVSQQSQPSKSGEKAKNPTARKKSKTEREDEDKPRERSEEKESGATVGRGSGRGSSKSPTSSPWASKDQVSSKEEPEADDDEEVEDDFDESKARGGVQPQLRSRKPPVNRDLTIGFGSGRPNPQANGRGNAGPPKKQRGVAQLVLGVHFPDHISGKPNPGMSKITQEQIEPQAEAADVIDAVDRGRRERSIGHVARPRLMPWMQQVVRDYFSSTRPID